MIRWINNYIGTGPSDYVKKENGIEIVDVRDMVDKAGNSVNCIREKIKIAINYLNQGKRIIVCCDYGISRSNAIAAGIIKKHENIPFDDAVQRVMSSTGEKSIKIEVLNVVRDAVEERVITSGSDIPRVLITGGTGFIGKKMAKRIGGKYDTYAPSSSGINIITDTVKLDMYIKRNVINTIVHLANPRITISNDAIGSTLVMLKNILEVCRENHAKLIYSSCWEVYSGYKSSWLMADEYLAGNPKGTYGETKYLAEQLIDTYIKNYGIDAMVLRISPVYGHGSDKPRFIYNFLKKALCNEKIVTHKYLNGYPFLDLINIDDVLSAFEKVIAKRISGILNIGSGNARSTRDIAFLIKEYTNSSSSIEHLGINSYSPNILMDTRKARSLLSWEATINFDGWIKSYIKETTK